VRVGKNDSQDADNELISTIKICKYTNERLPELDFCVVDGERKNTEHQVAFVN
jgi:hypothetical protein